MAFSSKHEITIKKLFEIQTWDISTPPTLPPYLHYQAVIKYYIFITLGIINKLFPFVYSHYKVNDHVKIKLKALETTGHFLGQNRRVTLCEADASVEGKLNPDRTYRVLERD